MLRRAVDRPCRLNNAMLGMRTGTSRRQGAIGDCCRPTAQRPRRCSLISTFFETKACSIMIHDALTIARHDMSGRDTELTAELVKINSSSRRSRSWPQVRFDQDGAENSPGISTSLRHKNKHSGVLRKTPTKLKIGNSYFRPVLNFCVLLDLTEMLTKLSVPLETKGNVICYE